MTNGERSMARWVAAAADHERAIFQLDLVQVGNRFDIDQVLITQEIMLHGEQQLGAAGVEPAFLAELGEHLRRFGDRVGLMNGKFS